MTGDVQHEKSAAILSLTGNVGFDVGCIFGKRRSLCCFYNVDDAVE